MRIARTLAGHVNSIALVEAIARRWNDAEVVYAVAHGIDDWPARLGRDLDVVVLARDASRAVAIARTVLHAHGLAVASPPPLWGERLVAADRESPDELLEIHTTTRITWRNTTVVERPEPSLQVGPFAIDPWISVAKRVVLPLLARGTRLLRSDPMRAVLDDAERGATMRHLSGLAGTRLATRLIHALDASNLDALDAFVPQLRRVVLRRGAIRHPFRSAGVLWHSLARRVREPLTPCAPVIAVVGTSGEDRGALVRTIADGDRLIFTNMIVRPRASGGTALGRVLRDRIDSSRQRLVLYDGHPPGTGPDALRMGDSRKAAGPWRRLLYPEPDLTILVGDRGRYPASGAGNSLAVLPPGISGDDQRHRAMALIIGAFMSKNGGAWRSDPDC